MHILMAASTGDETALKRWKFQFDSYEKRSDLPNLNPLLCVHAQRLLPRNRHEHWRLRWADGSPLGGSRGTHSVRQAFARRLQSETRSQGQVGRKESLWSSFFRIMPSHHYSQMGPNPVVGSNKLQAREDCSNHKEAWEVIEGKQTQK